MKAFLGAVACVFVVAGVSAQGSFVNWESPHVHPLEMTPDNGRLVAVNTAAARIEVFSLVQGRPVFVGAVPVGLDPVSVRARTADELWVVNHVSDSVSIVDLTTRQVVATLPTDDEPADVVFAGTPQRAFVSCSQANTILVFDPADLSVAPVRIPLEGEDPRAMAVRPDGSQVYVAMFESGNGTTILGGGRLLDPVFPPNVVSDPAGPWAGVNPPPNAGQVFDPPLNPNVPAPPEAGLIVRRDAQGQWFDDNGGDWTSLVTGPLASLSGRPEGWDVIDHDLAIIDTTDLSVEYVGGLMNSCMSVAVNPDDGTVTVVGTDATNEKRFEPNLKSVFLRVLMARVDPTGPTVELVTDLNEHLDYTVTAVAQTERDKSLGDPRGIAWTSGGGLGFVVGLGSNNLIGVTRDGGRLPGTSTIEVGEGPTGVVLNQQYRYLYVLNRFAGSISLLNALTRQEIRRLPFFDPTPAAIKVGRRHLFDTHATSGLGHVSCASCHIDARSDRLAWNLGNPAGDIQPLGEQNLAMNIPLLGDTFSDFSPMKGAMVTQTMQDIIGKEPFHWRGDRAGIEDFNPAFVGLLGDDQALTQQEMQEFEDYLATICLPPNPNRNLDNTLPESMPLPGHTSTGLFSPVGTPLPDGNAVNGLALFRPPNRLDNGVLTCSTCHSLPTGLGTDYWVEESLPLVPVPEGPEGQRHHMLVSLDGFTNRVFKAPQLRTLYEKTGFSLVQQSSRRGFGFLHDGSLDSLERFVSFFDVQSDQEIADIVAFMLAFSGSDLPSGDEMNFLEPPGTASQDTHAAVGRQVTIASAVAPQLLDDVVALADTGAVGLVVKGRLANELRGFSYLGLDLFQSDRFVQLVSLEELLAGAAPGAELTFTVTPVAAAQRIGVDADEDGAFDSDELDAGSDPDDPSSVPACADFLPAMPQALNVTGATRTSVDLTWVDGSLNEDGFLVERAVSGSGGPFTTLAVLAADAIAFTDGSVRCGTTYDYRVRAYNCAGMTTSAQVQATTVQCEDLFDAGPRPTGRTR